MQLIFVYGSLKRGLSNGHRLRGAKCVDGDAWAEGYGLVVYEGGYPGLVAARERRTLGEIYEASVELLAELDDFEECPDVYFREKIEVTMSTGERREAFAYLATRPEGFAPYPYERWQPAADMQPFEERRREA